MTFQLGTGKSLTFFYSVLIIKTFVIRNFNVSNFGIKRLCTCTGAEHLFPALPNLKLIFYHHYYIYKKKFRLVQHTSEEDIQKALQLLLMF
jgi:hypothetical protein